MVKNQNNIPDEWNKVKLVDLVKIYQGTGFPKILQGTKKGRYPFYKVLDISNNVFKGNIYLKECNNYINEEELKEVKGKVLPKNTIIFAKIGEALKLNRRAITTKECLIDNNTIGIKNIDRICSLLYLFYYFKRVRLENYSRATTVPSVRKSDIENIQINLPPLPEQHEIVRRIEAMFSELDHAIDTLKKAREQLKTYRQSVLKHAFEGKLTEKWREQQTDLEPADKLLEKIQAERQKRYEQQLKEWEEAVKKWEADGKPGKKPKKPQKPKEVSSLKKEDLEKLPELPNGWEWVKLGNLAFLITKGASPKWQGFQYLNDNNQLLFITSENVKENFIDVNKSKFLDLSFNNKQSNSILKYGDILINIVGASIGRAAKFNLDKKANINQAVSLVRIPFNGIIDYISMYLNSQTVIDFYNSKKVDVARANLSLDDISNIPIPLPLDREYYTIIQEIEQRLSVADNLEKSIENNLQKTESLRQSILKQAFEGKLTEDWRKNNPELVTGVNSAERLLEKIQEEKED